MRVKSRHDFTPVPGSGAKQLPGGGTGRAPDLDWARYPAGGAKGGVSSWRYTYIYIYMYSSCVHVYKNVFV